VLRVAPATQACLVEWRTVTALPLDPAPALPAGYDARVPTAEDVERVAALVTDHRRRVRGGGSVDIEERGTSYVLAVPVNQRVIAVVEGRA
jgi:hypothetical protein